MKAKTEFHQHPDGVVFVRTPTATYVDTIANFEADFGVKVPMLPEGVDHRLYTQGVRHALMESSEGLLVDGGPLPWDVGDAIIAAVAKGLDKQNKRREAEAAAIKAEQQAKMDAVVAETRRQLGLSADYREPYIKRS